MYLLNTRVVTCRAVGLCGFRNSLLVDVTVVVVVVFVFVVVVVFIVVLVNVAVVALLVVTDYIMLGCVQ